MDYLEIARSRQSCRAYDASRPVEEQKLLACLEAPGWRRRPATPSPTILRWRRATWPSRWEKPPGAWE